VVLIFVKPPIAWQQGTVEQQGNNMSINNLSGGQPSTSPTQVGRLAHPIRQLLPLLLCCSGLEKPISFHDPCAVRGGSLFRSVYLVV